MRGDEQIIDRLRRWLVPGDAVETEPISFIWSTWEDWLRRAGLQEEIGRVRAATPGPSVTRRDLKLIAQSTPDDDLVLFIATMIWGRGKKNARMLPGICRVLQHPQRDDVLAATRRHAQGGAVDAAYRAWKISGIGPPFFTKWLWASSFPGTPDRRPLVLDSLVWRSLGQLGWNSREAAGSRIRADRYQAYVDAAHRWAKQLTTPRVAVSAEHVEYALFNQGRRP